MLIPVRCFSCNHVLADKYEAYKKKIRDDGEKQMTAAAAAANVAAAVTTMPAAAAMGESEIILLKICYSAMTDLGIKNGCCHAMLLTAAAELYEM